MCVIGSTGGITVPLYLAITSSSRHPKIASPLFIMGQPKRACKSWLILGGLWDLSEGGPMWHAGRLASWKREGEGIPVPT
jgi:hypothetical protein